MNAILTFFSENFWATATALATASTLISGAIIGKFNPSYVWRQIIAWLISIGFTVGGYFLGIVNVADPAWLSLTATGLVVGLESNGVYDIPAMKKLVREIFGEAIQAK